MKLFETIRFRNGSFENLPFHQQRMDRSRKLLFALSEPISLSSALHSETYPAPPAEMEQTFKCRVIYSQSIESIEYIPYTIPSISTLKIVHDNTVEYPFKYKDREQLERLYGQRGDCDDVLIIRNGLVTDTSYANVLCFNGTEWLTPESPLLAGTRRAMLLQKKKIRTGNLTIDVLKSCQKIRLINAMIRFEDRLEIPVKNILK